MKSSRKPQEGQGSSCAHDELLTEIEAAELLRISARKLWGMRVSGEVPHIKIRSAIRYRRSSLLRWLEELEKGGDA